MTKKERELQLHQMKLTESGREEIINLYKKYNNISTGKSITGILIGKMIDNIIEHEYPNT